MFLEFLSGNGSWIIIGLVGVIAACLLLPELGYRGNIAEAEPTIEPFMVEEFPEKIESIEHIEPAPLDKLIAVTDEVAAVKEELLQVKEEMRRSQEESSKNEARIEALRHELMEELKSKYSTEHIENLSEELHEEIKDVRDMVNEQSQQTNISISQLNEKIGRMSSDFEQELITFKKSLEEQSDKINSNRDFASEMATIRAELASLSSKILVAETHQAQTEVGGIVDREIETYKADKTGMADFALESAGAEILPELSSKGLTSNAAMIKIWNFPIIYHTISPRIAIQPEVNPGNCFAFKGPEGVIGIKLSRQIVVQNVTIEHIPKVNIPIQYS